jgi:hypothetical protein
MAQVKENDMLAIQLANLEAFCQDCPAISDVHSVLEELGFRLVFEMHASTFSKNSQLPTLPAQYHYRDTDGTELIFLAGKDHPEQDMPRFPLHSSHWWLYAGSSQYAYNLVAQVLSTKFGLDWIAA